MVLALIGLSPAFAHACACGCGIFEVGTSSLFPQGAGGQVWTQWKYMHQYTPGREVDGAVGASYDFGNVGPLSELAPIFNILASDRTRDTGANADPADSGYTRFLAAPGGEIRFGPMRLYSDIEFPIFQNERGYQLTAPWATKVILSYSF
jgi:hypothetical protein